MRTSGLLTASAVFSAASAVYQGFNYGSTQSDGSVKDTSAFTAEFKAAQGLAGTDGAFTSARLYTCIQGGTTQDPISAFEAAISTKTQLLLGMWASSGSGTISSEINALKTALNSYGTDLVELIIGISVGSEDLYRISPTGVLNLSGAGAEPDDIVSYISQVRQALSGTALSSVKIGHVDTWTAWVNGSNSAVVSASDFIGVDAYPYFQNTMSNGIDSGESLFFDAYDATVAAAQGKDVWITETGWPVSGKTENLAVASTDNAKTYWDEVGCARSFGKINTFWFTLQDAYPTTPNPSFGVASGDLNFTPLFDLSCSGVSAATSSSSGNTDAVSTTATSSATGSSTEHSDSGSSSASVTVTLVTPTGDTPLSPTQGGEGGAGAGSNSSSNVTATTVATGTYGTGSGTGSLTTSVTASSNSSVSTASRPSSSSTTTTGTTSGNAAPLTTAGIAGSALAVVLAIAALM